MWNRLAELAWIRRNLQLHGVNAAKKVVLRKKLRRKEMVAFFKALAPAVIGIEGCGASHHWARILRSFGHEVKLIAPPRPSDRADFGHDPWKRYCESIGGPHDGAEA